MRMTKGEKMKKAARCKQQRKEKRMCVVAKKTNTRQRRKEENGKRGRQKVGEKKRARTNERIEFVQAESHRICLL